MRADSPDATLLNSEVLTGILEHIARETPASDVLFELMAIIKDSQRQRSAICIVNDLNSDQPLIIAGPQTSLELLRPVAALGSAAFPVIRSPLAVFTADGLWSAEHSSAEWRLVNSAAANAGLSECWTVSICSRKTVDAPVLGSLVVFTAEAVTSESPLPSQMACVEYLAAIVIEHEILLRSLRQNEARLRQLVNSASDALFLHDHTGRITDVNEEACRQLEYTREELIGRSLTDLCPDISKEALASVLMRLQHGEQLTFESGRQRRDGTTYPIEVRLRPAGNGLKGLGIATVLNISDRWDAQDSLRRQTILLESGQTLAHLGSFELSLVTGRLSWSDELYRIYGYAPQEREMTLDGFLSHIHPEDQERVQTKIADACRDKSGFRMEERIVRRDGTIRVLESQGQVIVDNSGNPVRLVGTCLDITDRRQAEERLRETHLQLSLIYQTTADILFLIKLDTDGGLRFQSVNPAFVNRTGLAAETISGLRIEDVIPEPSLSLVRNHCQQAITENRIVRWEETAIYPAGVVVGDVCIAPVMSDDGRCTHLVGSVHDITARKQAEQALQESEQRFRSVLDFSPAVIYLKDLEGRYLFVNRRVAELFGIPQSEWIGKTADELLPPAVAEMFSENDRRLILGGGPQQVEETATFDNGPEITCLTVQFLLFRTNGQPYAICGIAQDITDRKRFELALRESEERFRNVLDFSPSIIFLKNLDGRYLFVNRHGALRMQIPQQEWHGRTARDVFPRETAERIEANDRLVFETLQPLQLEEKIKLFSGQECIFLSILFPLLSTDGLPYAICGVLTEITEWKRAEEAVRASEQEFADFFENATVGIHLLAADGTILRANPAVLSLLGYHSEEYTGRNISEFYECRAVADDILRRLHSKETVESYAARLVCRDGSVRDVLIDYSVRWEAGQLLSIRCFTRDVTEVKRLEEQFRQAQKMEAVGRLAGGVAHDFNNLLTVINGYTEVLLTQLTGMDARREQLLAIKDAGERAAGLTSQLLAFSRNAIIEPRTMDLNVVVESTARMLRRLIGEDIILVVNQDPDLEKISADPGQLEQVIMNLAVNARDAMPVGGRLTIETHSLRVDTADGIGYTNRKSGLYAQLIVADTGHGMSEEVKSKIFEPFFTTKGIGKGTGLGLSVVHGIVQQCGGYIDVESTAGSGTEFRIMLPAVRALSEVKHHRNRPVGSNGTETILLVEDEDNVRKIARIALEAHGFKVVEADRASAAIEMMNRFSKTVDLLVTDVVMPEMGGRQLVETLRQHHPAMRVLYISGHTDDAVVLHGLTDTTDAFLQKPFTPQVLARKVRAVIDGIR